jgi:hypothetical protein
MDGIDTFDSPLLADVQLNDDGTLKQSGKQNVKFYNKKRLSFRARPLWVRQDDGEIAHHPNGKPVRAMDDKGKPAFEIDPKTGLPFKDAFEEVVEMIRVETKGDTNIKEDVADAFSKRQFNRQYKYFRSGQIPDGHSIEDFEFLQPSTITELHMFGIHTLEQLADLPEVDCEQIKDQSGFEIKDIARQWLKINSPDGLVGKADRMELENVRLRRELEALKAGKRGVRSVEREQIPAEEAVIDSGPDTMEISTEEMKRGPGRPRKV